MSFANEEPAEVEEDHENQESNENESRDDLDDNDDNVSLQGYDDRIIQGVVGRIDCQELCLIETEFACASAEYEYF